MNSPQKASTFNRLPAWQREHAARLHTICGYIAVCQVKGKKLSRSVAFFVRKWSGKSYKTDPSRKFTLSRTTLYRVYAQWQAGGSTPSAICPRYRATNSKLKPAQLRAFLRLLFMPGTRSAVHAFDMFKHRRPGARPISYAALMRHLPLKVHQQLRAAEKAVTDAEVARAKLRLTIEAQALATLPPSRREPDFQI